MSVYQDPNAPRVFTWGNKVEKASAALPQTTTGALFTVAGGRVLVTSLVGQVTVATGATATTLLLVSTPTTGTAVNIATASSVASLEAGAQLSLNATALGALVVGAANSGAIAVPQGYALCIPAGVIGATTSANNTGSIKWTLTYIPYDNGSIVTAA